MFSWLTPTYIPQRAREKIFLNEREIEVKEKDTGEKKFFFIEVGAVTYYRTEHVIWVHRDLVNVAECENWKGEKVLKRWVTPPLRAQIHVTEKGTKVFRPSQTTMVHGVFIPGGFRGISEIKIVQPEDVVFIPYTIYFSEKASIGKGAGAIVQTGLNEKVVVAWRRTGRTYSHPVKGVSVYHPDGRIEHLDSLTEEDLKDLDKYLD